MERYDNCGGGWTTPNSRPLPKVYFKVVQLHLFAKEEKIKRELKTTPIGCFKGCQLPKKLF